MLFKILKNLYFSINLMIVKTTKKSFDSVGECALVIEK